MTRICKVRPKNGYCEYNCVHRMKVFENGSWVTAIFLFSDMQYAWLRAA